jgi:hypothetical protein
MLSQTGGEPFFVLRFFDPPDAAQDRRHHFVRFGIARVYPQRLVAPVGERAKLVDFERQPRAFFRDPGVLGIV